MLLLKQVGVSIFLLETDSFSKVTANRIKLEFHNNNNKNDLAYSIIESDDEENGRIVIEKNVDNPDPNNPRKTVRITFADAELDKIDPLVNWDLLGNGSSSTVAGKFRFNYINHIDGRVVNALFIPDDLDTYNIVSKSQFLPN